jgi:hypothetical protein
MDLTGGTTRMLRMAYKAAATPLAFRSPVNSKPVALAAIDRSAAAVLDEKGLLVAAVKPCCTVLRADLATAGIAPEQMADVNVSFAGKNWRVLSVQDKPDPSWRVTAGQLKPVPNWNALGEVLFTLMEV